MKPKTPFKWVFMNIIPAISYKILTKDTTFNNYLLIVDFYSKLPELYRMENITTEEVTENIYMFQEIFGKLDEFEGWDMDRIKTDSGTKLNPKEFQEGLSVHEKKLALATPDHQRMNDQVEVTC